MKIIGIVVEYNPFHNGHLYQINKIKKDLHADAVVVVMSGNFAQRGIPCITDKYTRTRMALLNGVDVVIELPVPFATSSAQYFAEASIGILHHLNSIHTLCFGSEHVDLELLKSIAQVLLNEPNEISTQIQTLLSKGISYPQARQEAISDYFQNDTLNHILKQPNVILGIEYIKALLKYNSPIECVPIQRIVSGYHDTSISDSIASASAIRHAFSKGEQLITKKVLPPTSYMLLENIDANTPTINDFSDFLKYKCIFSNVESFYSLWDIPKNLCRSIAQASSQFDTLEEIINASTSKTYSRSTVQRAIIRILLDIKSKDIEQLQALDWTPYIRVIGCHPQSRHVLAYLFKNSTVPILTSLSKSYNKLDSLQKMLLDYELASTKLYALSQHHFAISQSDFSTNIFPFDLSNTSK